MPVQQRRIASIACTTAFLVACACDDISGPPDTTAPAAIADLRVSRTSAESVTLSWTAPGDDAGAGRAARYLVRYWAAPEYSFVWDQATPVPAAAIPVPADAGTHQECTIVGLTAFQLVYCAVRTVDDAGNLAPLSNRIPTAAETPVATSELDVVRKLALAYQELDPGRFEALLHSGYEFICYPLYDGTLFWDAGEEVSIHRRMLRPADVPATEPPVPLELWLDSIDLTMIQATPFVPRPQYYVDPVGNPQGLDPNRWEVLGADFYCTVFFETRGDTDYRIESHSEFIIANDLTKATGEAGKFTLYRWYDLGAGLAPASEQKTWTAIKRIYWR